MRFPNCSLPQRIGLLGPKIQCPSRMTDLPRSWIDADRQDLLVNFKLTKPLRLRMTSTPKACTTKQGAGEWLPIGPRSQPPAISQPWMDASPARTTKAKSIKTPWSTEKIWRWPHTKRPLKEQICIDHANSSYSDKKTQSHIRDPPDHELLIPPLRIL